MNSISDLPVELSQSYEEKYKMPNIRKMFVPDDGYFIFEGDLKGADAQVVAWEAQDEELMEAFRQGLDVHAMNAEAMMGSRFTSLQGEARYAARQKNKQAVHGTNYGGGAKAIAAATGWTVHEAELFQRRWFALHPKIRSWHRRIEGLLLTKREVCNSYGYRIHYFDRTDGLLPEALAWIPQSTVAIACFRGMLKLEKEFPYVEHLLQVHDSCVFQTPLRYAGLWREFAQALRTVTPYDVPLTIPWDIEGSDKSWGDKTILS